MNSKPIQENKNHTDTDVFIAYPYDLHKQHEKIDNNPIRLSETRYYDIKNIEKTYIV